MSAAPLTPLGDAIAVARRLGAALALGHEHVPIAEALGRTASADVRAVRALPGFASSAMDGFAVRAADLAAATDAAPVALRITEESRAGALAGGAVGVGDAIRIATGAVVPEGADAVVPYEEVSEADGRATFTAPVDHGAFVRAAGTDVAAGATLVPAGTRLAPHHLAPLSGAGHGQVPVHRRPRVSVLFTGDEVVRGAGPEAALPPGHVHDVNGVVLPALVRAWGGEVAEVVPLPDDRDVTRDAIAWASGDVLVLCGGMSMGPHDHVRPPSRSSARGPSCSAWRCSPASRRGWARCPARTAPGRCSGCRATRRPCSSRPRCCCAPRSTPPSAGRPPRRCGAG